MSKSPDFKTEKKFNLNKTPYDPFTGNRLPFDPYSNPRKCMCRVLEEHFNYLMCITIESQLLRVAKPIELRSYKQNEDGSNFTMTLNGVDYEYSQAYPSFRIASDPDGVLYDEQQMVTPTYYKDAWIIAEEMNCIIKYIEYDGDGNPIGQHLLEWYDINDAGRVWATTLLTEPS